MAYTLNYSSKSLLDVKFEPNVKGYDALEVDQVLDQLIDDLKFYEKYYNDSRNYIRTLETEVQNLKDKIRDMEMEVASIKNKYSGIKPGQEVNDVSTASARPALHLPARITEPGRSTDARSL